MLYYDEAPACQRVAYLLFIYNGLEFIGCLYSSIIIKINSEIISPVNLEY